VSTREYGSCPKDNMTNNSSLTCEPTIVDRLANHRIDVEHQSYSSIESYEGQHYSTIDNDEQYPSMSSIEQTLPKSSSTLTLNTDLVDTCSRHVSICDGLGSSQIESYTNHSNLPCNEYSRVFGVTTTSNEMIDEQYSYVNDRYDRLIDYIDRLCNVTCRQRPTDETIKDNSSYINTLIPCETNVSKQIARIRSIYSCLCVRCRYRQ
jgi:hypothetical protein